MYAGEREERNTPCYDWGAPMFSAMTYVDARLPVLVKKKTVFTGCWKELPHSKDNPPSR